MTTQHAILPENTVSLRVGQATVRYRTYGSGPGLVLVHGTGSGSVTWEGLVDRFADRYTVVLPDLSGSDPVRDDGAPLTVEVLTEQLAAVIAHTGLGPVDVVGHSLGAIVALSLAATRPGLVRRLVPIAGFGRGDDAYLRATWEQYLALADRPAEFARFAMLTAFGRTYLRGLGKRAVDELARDFLPTRGRIRQFEAVRRADVHGLLARIEAPTLVIGCTEDHLVPAENVRQVHAALPGSEYAELVCGHVARVERPDELAALVRGFLDRRAGRT
ncbi:alpha/beta fold hydrolase [Streptomyces sp. NPDC048182]|uniref:alpha/beta fold hydrolase n=1 Tax=Streptomyces sp. NPDC048182 TaxID=3365507 RepID=UPI003718BBDC